MLIDGISLANGSAITNSYVESGPEFPTADVTPGRIYYLNAVSGINQIGLYVYNGSVWLTGDITEVGAGTGLLGGGAAGALTLSVNTEVIATVTRVDDLLKVIDLGTY